MIASLLILVGMGAITVSCRKEENTKFRKAKITSCESNNKDGGEDDDDPIIRGRVKKRNNSVVDSAHVETLTYLSNVKVGDQYTDDAGEFEQTVTIGKYYFRVTVPGVSTPYITDTIHVNADRNIEITVD